MACRTRLTEEAVGVSRARPDAEAVNSCAEKVNERSPSGEM